MIPVLADLLPNVNELFEYKGFFGQHEWYEFNKTAALAFVSTIICIGLFYVGSRKKAMVPGGLQNVAEMGYETVEQQIAVEVMGPENGKKWNKFQNAVAPSSCPALSKSSFPGGIKSRCIRCALPIPRF